MTPPILIATTGWDPEAWAARVRPHLPGRVIHCTDRKAVFHGPDSALADVAYLLAWKPVEATIRRLPALKAIFSLGAGVDHIMGVPRLPDVPIARIVDPDLTGRMTEWVVWQALEHLRRGATYRRLQAEGRWGDVQPPPARAVTVGLMGLGAIGRDAADILMRLGFDVRAWTRSPKEAPGIKVFAGADGLDAFLAGTDILVSLLPLTPDTRGMVDLALLRKLKRGGALGGPVYMNAGRGGTQVEADIAIALSDGTLAAASIDVFETEPLPTESPLWGLETLTITPHVAAVSSPDALAGQIAGQILAFERGEPLRNLVDPTRGY